MPRWLLSSSNWCPLSCSCFPVCVCVCVCVCGRGGWEGRETGARADRQTDRQTRTQTDRHTHSRHTTDTQTHAHSKIPYMCPGLFLASAWYASSLSLSLSASAHAFRMCLCVPLHVFLTTCVPYECPYIYADMPPYVSVYAPQRRSRVRLRIGSTRNCRSGEWMPRVCSCGSNVLLDRMRTSSDRWGMRRDEWWWKGRRRRRRRRRRVY